MSVLPEENQTYDKTEGPNNLRNMQETGLNLVPKVTEQLSDLFQQVSVTRGY